MLAVLRELGARGVSASAVFIGDGDQRARLEREAASAGLDVAFPGWVDDRQPLAAGCDCLLLPSDVEGLGMVLVEAAGMGLPSVAPSPALGVADAVVPGLTGILSLSTAPRTSPTPCWKPSTCRATRPWPPAGCAASTPTTRARLLERVLTAAVERAPRAPVPPAPTQPPVPTVPPGVADAPTLVRHYGPGPDDPGGMSAVVAAYLALPLPRHRMASTASYRPGARAASLAPFLGALAGCWGRAGPHRWSTPTCPRAGRSCARAACGGGGAARRAGGRVAARRGLRAVRGPVPAAGARRAGPRRRRRRPGAGGGGRGRAAAGTPHPARRRPQPGRPAAAPGPAGDRPETVVFAGEVGRRKGVDVLLAAWPRVRAARPGARLVLAGPPGDVAPPPLPGVDVLGARPRAAVGDLLAGARAAVLPSRAEVLPVFLLEAMAAARPVVATPVGEVAHLVDGAGVLVRPGDPAALAGALVDVLTDPGLATARGEAGRRRVAGAHAPAAVAAELAALYDPPGRRSVT